tara:strand:+ start:54329 stop:54433 length:105 start_codon:yes stop_codon:yes gene_type:complete
MVVILCVQEKGDRIVIDNVTGKVESSCATGKVAC